MLLPLPVGPAIPILAPTGMVRSKLSMTNGPLSSYRKLIEQNFIESLKSKPQARETQFQDP